MTAPQSTRTWLESHGLGELAAVFEHSRITPDLLPTLTADDLREMGITALGHRKRVLAAITTLGAPGVLPVVDDAPAREASWSAVASDSATPLSQAHSANKSPQRTAKASDPASSAPSGNRQSPAPAKAVSPPLQGSATALQNAVAPNIAPSTNRKRKVFSGGFLTVSIALHLVLGLAAGYWVIQELALKRKLQFKEGPPTASPSKRALEHKVSLQKKKNAGGAPAQAKRIAVTGLAAKITLPEMPTMPVSATQFVPGRIAGLGGAGFGTGLGSGNGSGVGVGGGGTGGLGLTMFPPAFKGRCNPAERVLQLAKNGGTPEHDAAVTKTLDWLKAKQNSDGSWGARFQAGMTGFALLAYLGRCATPDDPQYGETVMKAILYLVENSKKNGNGMMTMLATSNGAVYEHGIATYALGEMYALARMGKKQLPGMREAFEQGVEVVISRQSPDGGWRYFTPEPGQSAGSDLSVTGWQYQALKAARLTELRIPNLEQSIEKAAAYLRSRQNVKPGAEGPPGGFGSRDNTRTYNQFALSGVGIVGLQTLDKSGSRPQVKLGLDFTMQMFKAQPPSWDTNCNVYAWYYYTQACFHAGGSEWRYWNDTVMPQILAAQNPDGSWKPEGPSITYTPPKFTGGVEGEVYRACLCVLMLESYYRYLKVN